MGEGAVSDRRLRRDRAVSRVLWIVLGLNLGVAALKLAVGAATGALSLLADGVHALLDASSNVVGLFGIAVASRPADAGHPYGHRRFETLAAVSIGLLILTSMAGILRGVWEGASGQRAAPNISWVSAGLVFVTILANLVISRYEAKRGVELRSALLEADSGHTLSDTFGAIAVLVSFGAIALGFRWADIAAAGIVSVLIGRTAWSILGTNLGVLADRARLDPLRVREVALQVHEVRGAHKIRSRGSADHVHVDLHIHVDPGMTVERAHAITHEVARAVRAAFPEVADVMIHTEPADGREHDVASISPSEKRIAR
jgi:cation diffusion facilitator family transporter